MGAGRNALQRAAWGWGAGSCSAGRVTMLVVTMAGGGSCSAGRVGLAQGAGAGRWGWGWLRVQVQALVVQVLASEPMSRRCDHVWFCKYRAVGARPIFLRCARRANTQGT